MARGRRRAGRGTQRLAAPVLLQQLPALHERFVGRLEIVVAPLVVRQLAERCTWRSLRRTALVMPPVHRPRAEARPAPPPPRTPGRGHFPQGRPIRCFAVSLDMEVSIGSLEGSSPAGVLVRDRPLDKGYVPWNQECRFFPFDLQRFPSNLEADRARLRSVRGGTLAGHYRPTFTNKR